MSFLTNQSTFHVGIRLFLCLSMAHTVAGLSHSPSFITSLRRPLVSSVSNSRCGMRLHSSFGREQDPVVEVVQSLVDFHEGVWEGQARSFTVTPDVAAGIVKRKLSAKYTVSVKLGLDSNRDPALTESMSWDDNQKVSFRSMSLSACNADVDSVDASYSLDSKLPDFPTEISGTDKLCQFVIEHCIAASDDRRVRCLIFYGVDQSLHRVVVCEENRVKQPLPKSDERSPLGKEGLTAADLFEMENEVDSLVDKISEKLKAGGSLGSGNREGGSSSNDVLRRLQQGISESQQKSPDDASLKLSPHRMSLVELTSGVWLGDTVIRDFPMILGSPEQPGRGFGSDRSVRSSMGSSIGRWDVGVQKVAWRWMWNFGQEIRQVNDAGKAMGSTLSPSMQQSLSGAVCINESVSRRVPLDERMVYIDWNVADMVGFVLGSTSIQAPRYMNFNPSSSTSSRRAKPFFTELSHYQSNVVSAVSVETVDTATLPEICCSKMSRVYNFEGQLKQGCTSFSTLQRFGVEGQLD
jgi:hypothetical protein